MRFGKNKPSAVAIGSDFICAAVKAGLVGSVDKISRIVINISKMKQDIL